MKKCSICSEKIQLHKTPEGKVYWSDGHNAQPVNNGRCCDDCNEQVVIPVRLASFFGKDNPDMFTFVEDRLTRIKEGE